MFWPHQGWLCVHHVGGGDTPVPEHAMVHSAVSLSMPASRMECFPRYNHRIPAWFLLEGTLKLIQLQPLPWAGTPSIEQVAPSPCVQPGLEHCQQWGSHSFSGHPVPAPQHPHREQLVPKSSPQSALVPHGRGTPGGEEPQPHFTITVVLYNER